MLTLVGLSTLILPSPEQGDQETIDLRTVIKSSMNGTRYSFTSRPIIKTFDYSFTYMNGPKREEIRKFLIANRGRKLVLTDHKNVVRNVQIKSEPIEIVHQGIRNHTLTLQFEEVPS